MLMMSMTHEGMGQCLAVEDATTREVFEIYLEQTLRPALQLGQMMVMDYPSSITKAKASRQAYRGARLRTSMPAALPSAPQPDSEAFERLSRGPRDMWEKPKPGLEKASPEARGAAITTVGGRPASGLSWPLRARHAP